MDHSEYGDEQVEEYLEIELFGNYPSTGGRRRPPYRGVHRAAHRLNGRPLFDGDEADLVQARLRATIHRKASTLVDPRVRTRWVRQVTSKSDQLQRVPEWLYDAELFQNDGRGNDQSGQS